MLTLKNSQHIPTSNNIKHFHLCRMNTGVSLCHCEALRIYNEGTALFRRKLRRLWLAQQWGRHMESCRRQQALQD
jgi:hypothetical protein